MSQSEPTPQDFMEPADDVVSTPGADGYDPQLVAEVQNTQYADDADRDAEAEADGDAEDTGGSESA